MSEEGVVAPRVIQWYHGLPAYWCPVCDHPHRIGIKGKPLGDVTWDWNGELDKPTFAPSIHSLVSEHNSLSHFVLKRDGLKACDAKGIPLRFDWENEALDYIVAHEKE